jgi:hypothetical protein
MVLVLPAPARAQPSLLGDLDLTLVMEVDDVVGWRAFHTEVLGTKGQHALEVAIETANGGSRALTVTQPRFEVSLVRGKPRVKVTVRGKLGAIQALGELGAFEEAVAENHARSGDALVGLYYGLSTVGADLIELHGRQ